jgi:hypothetical protein
LANDIEKEIVMIANTNTVINPRTMMIKSLNAMMADTTVPTTGSANGLTVRAQVSAIVLLQKINKWNLFLQVARVSY